MSPPVPVLDDGSPAAVSSATEDLDLALSAHRVAHPGLTIRPLVLRDDPAAR